MKLKCRRLFCKEFRIVALVISIGIGALFLGRHLFPSSKTAFIDNYNRLELGSTRTQVEELLGRQPDHVFLFKTSEIWYCQAWSDLTTHDLSENFASSVAISSLTELPDSYNYVQLAFGSDGQLFAYTWIGEDPFVHAVAGDVEGSFLGKLSEDQF